MQTTTFEPEKFWSLHPYILKDGYELQLEWDRGKVFDSDGAISPSDYLSEIDLISLVQKHGTGMDASISVHIHNICERNYVQGIGCTKITKAKNEGSVNGNLESRSYLEKKLVFSFGSYIAAQMLLPFGEENFLSSSELKQAQEIATRMVIQYGWGPDDSPAIYITSNAVGTLSMGKDHELEMAAKVEKMYDLGYEKAKKILLNNRSVLEKTVEQLLMYESLTGEDLFNIVEDCKGVREQEPFSLLRHDHEEITPHSFLDNNGNAAVMKLLGATT